MRTSKLTSKPKSLSAGSWLHAMRPETYYRDPRPWYEREFIHA